MLRVDRVPIPVPGPGELLLQVDAAGVTLPVVRQTRGGAAAVLPHAPGGDVVGEVVGVGAGVEGWGLGSRAAAIAGSGAYADHVVVAAALATQVPDGVDDATAVALVRGGQVALGVLTASGVQDGETALVTAAAGGVGHLLVQLARHRGAGRVIAAVGSMDKAGFVQELGADEVVPYDDVAANSVDVALDGVGGVALRAGLDALRPGGRLVTFSGVGGPVDANELRMRGTAVIGFGMPHLLSQQPHLFAEHRSQLWDLVRAHRLRAMVHTSLPLEHAEQAHRIIEDRQNTGRVVLTT